MEVVINLSQAQQRFLSEQALPQEYLTHAQQWFNPIADEIAQHQNRANRPIIVGINGCQGSGKSTLADYLAMFLGSQYHLNCAVLSLDDFYLDQQQRQQLAQKVHPLLATRGVPGTHDTELMFATLMALKEGRPTALPRFNKAIDNPFPQSQWPVAEKPVDIVLMEGWCWGVPPQTEAELLKAINELEQCKDPQGTWRRYVNQQLLETYQPLFELADISLMLKAPSFACVMQWRLEQERKLAKKVAGKGSTTGVMSEAQVKQFISYFQRLTEHSLAFQPKLCDVVWQLDSTRTIHQMEHPKELLA